MKTLVYAGGEIKGYKLDIGDKFQLVNTKKIFHMGLNIYIYEISNMNKNENVFINTKELMKSFQLLN